MLLIANLVSLSAIVLFMLPWSFFVATKHPVFLWMGIAVSLADGSTKIWKRLFGTASIFGRPYGACDCDIFCINGTQNGKPGFPSGHMTVTSFLATTFALLQPGLPYQLAAIAVVIAMGWARYFKKCHNLMQIVAGTIYGFFVATFFVACAPMDIKK